MGKGSELKLELQGFLKEFGVPEDIQDPKIIQFFDEGGLVRMAIRRRIGFCGECCNRISRAVLAMEQGNVEPIRSIDQELSQIGVQFEFSSGGEDYKLGDPVSYSILLFKGSLTDRLK